MISPADLLALCVLKEAGGEADDGRAAIVRVIMNRMARRFMSDGTIPGTILAHDQFSWVEWDMVGGKYVRVAKTPAQIDARATKLLQQAWAASPHTLTACGEIGRHVLDGTYVGGPHYAQLTGDTVNYVNPRIVSAPAWAIPSKFVCAIGNHNFYRA